MKPFDIELAKQGKPVCTRDGRKARIICFNTKSYKGKEIIALVTKPDGSEYVRYFTQDGRLSYLKDDRDDLMMLPEKKEMWINIYKGTTGPAPGAGLYDTEEEAKDATNGDENYVTTTKVCWEE